MNHTIFKYLLKVYIFMMRRFIIYPVLSDIT